MRFCGVETVERSSLGARLVLSSAYDPGSFEVELGEIGAGCPILWIEGYRLLKFVADFLRQSGRGEKAHRVSLLSVRATEPQMKFAVVRIKRNGFLAGGDGAVPVVYGEVDTAQQVVGSGIVGRRANAAAQLRDGIVHPSGGKQVEGSVRREGGYCEYQDGKDCEFEMRLHFLLHHLHGGSITERFHI